MADTSRKSTSMPVRPPSRSTWRSSRTRRSFACDTSGRSPISSRNRRPAIGQLDPSEPPLVRAGEGALLVAEDLGLEQRIGNGRAADGLERSRLPAAQVVDGACGHFLAGAGGTEDQHRDVGLGRGADRLEHQQHLLVAADQLEELPHRRGLAAADLLDGRRQEAGEQAVGALVGRSRRAVPGRDAVPSACDAGADQRLETPLGIPRACSRTRPSAPRCRTSRRGARGGTAAARRGAAIRPASETAGPKARQAPRWLANEGREKTGEAIRSGNPAPMSSYRSGPEMLQSSAVSASSSQPKYAGWWKLSASPMGAQLAQWGCDVSSPHLKALARHRWPPAGLSGPQ